MMPSIPDPFSEIKILSTQALPVPNEWLDRPIIKMEMDIGAYENISSASVSHFNDQLLAAIPTLWEHKCSVGTSGGFVKRLRDGTYPAHITEHVAIELQCLAGDSVVYGKARSIEGSQKGLYRIVFETARMGFGLRAGELALYIVQSAFAGALTPSIIDNALAELR